MSKIIFVSGDQQNDEEVTYIRDWDDFYNIFDWDETSGIGCYIIEFHLVGREHLDVNIYDLMCWVAQNIGEQYHLINISVNSTDIRFEDWLQAASEFPEANVFLTSKRDREIAFISWPSVHYFNR